MLGWHLKPISNKIDNTVLRARHVFLFPLEIIFSKLDLTIVDLKIIQTVKLLLLLQKCVPHELFLLKLHKCSKTYELYVIVSIELFMKLFL